MADGNEMTFGLVHGAWHGAWCWQLLQRELEGMHYRSVAMDLPIDNPRANFDDYADTVVGALEHEQEVVLVGHSRAGNVIPRVAGRLAVKKLIYLCATFEPETIRRPTGYEKEHVPPMDMDAFRDKMIPTGNGMFMFAKESAKELFYHDCQPKVQEWAASNLRLQRRSSDEPLLEAWPDAPQAYILCKDDRVVNPEWSRYAARRWLNIDPIEIDSGHSPFLSRPRELAALLISLVREP